MRKESVILVEDSKVQGRITKDLLEMSGYDTTWVISAEEALKDELYKKYDIILLDVILPGIDGYECCRIIKSDQKCIIPIIMLTSRNDEESVIKALESGADDYIKKPYSIQEFIARIRVQLRTKKLQSELIEKNNELKKANITIKNLAITDTLTGVKNRSYLPYYIQNLVDTYRKKRLSICMMMIDIDNFKSINDNYGHLTGDKVLKHIATICKDSVGDNGVVVRFGGEEFLVLQEKNIDTHYEIAENIRRRCEESKPCGFRVTLSVGVNIKTTLVENYNIFKQEFESSIKKADQMLYKSKETGKNKITTYKKQKA